MGQLNPIGSMNGIFTYIYHQLSPKQNVSTVNIPGTHGSVMAINEPSQLSQPINFRIEDVLPIEIVPFCRTSISWLGGANLSQLSSNDLPSNSRQADQADSCQWLQEIQGTQKGVFLLVKVAMIFPVSVSQYLGIRLGPNKLQGCFGEKIWRSRIGITFP